MQQNDGLADGAGTVRLGIGDPGPAVDLQELAGALRTQVGGCNRTFW